MKNRYINYLLALVLGIGIMSSCQKILEVEVTGAADFDEDFLRTPEDAQELLNASYDALSSGAFLGGQVQELSEIMADNIAERPATLNGNWAAVYSRTTDIFLDVTRSTMSAAGNTMARANMLIDSIHIVEGLNGERRDAMIAEAKFLRAIAHWELVKMFAQPYGYTSDNSHPGVPLRTSFTIAPVDRSTVGEVYAQIISDLQDAANELPTENGSYATRDAALGYLAKVYFQMNDFQNAYANANEVIQSNRYPLDTNLNGRFARDLTSESVFHLVSSERDNSGGRLWGSYRRDPSNNDLAPLSLSAEMAGQLLIGDDKRGERWVLESDDFFWSTKVEDTTGGVNWTQVPLVHLTELLLIRAESAAENGENLEQAVSDINQIRDRAGIPTLSNNANAETIITTARDERRKELVIEGNRLHELKRQAVRGNASLTIRGAPWDCNGMVFQFPDSELAGNLNMQPNPEGGCN